MNWWIHLSPFNDAFPDDWIISYVDENLKYYRKLGSYPNLKTAVSVWTMMGRKSNLSVGSRKRFKKVLRAQENI